MFPKFQTPQSWLKKTRLRLVFPTYFSGFGNRRKHSSSCLIYYFCKILGKIPAPKVLSKRLLSNSLAPAPKKKKSIKPRKFTSSFNKIVLRNFFANYLFSLFFKCLVSKKNYNPFLPYTDNGISTVQKTFPRCVEVTDRKSCKTNALFRCVRKGIRTIK